MKARTKNRQAARVYPPRECDIVLCDGVTMHVSSAAYPIDSMRLSADATKPGDLLFCGDIKCKNFQCPRGDLPCLATA